MTVTIYSRPTCAPCHTLKKYLTTKNIPFITRDIDADSEAQAEAFKLAGMSIVPVTVVEKEGTTTVITGLNMGALIPALQ